MDAEGRGLWGREGRPCSPAAVEGHFLDYVAGEAATAALQQLTDRDALGAGRNPSPESCTAEVPTVWLDVEPGPRGRGVRAQSWAGSQPLTSAAAPPLHLPAPEGGRAWAGERRGAKSRSAGTGDRRRRSAESLVVPASDSESSDEIDIAQMMSVTISRKGLATPRSPEGPEDAPRPPSTHVKEGSLHAPGPFLSSSPGGLTSAVAEQEAPSSEKTPSVVWGKVQSSRPSYLVGAAAAPGGLLTGTPLKRAPEAKRSLGRGSHLALGRGFPSRGQRVPAPPAPAEPLTLPAISAMPLLVRSKKPPWAPAGIEQPKHTSAGKKSVARRTGDSEPMAEEDNRGKGDRVPKGQPPAHKPGPPSLCMHRGGFSGGGDVNTGSPLPPRPLQHLVPSQGDARPRGRLTAWGDQEPLDRPPGLERRPRRRQQKQQQKQQQPPVAEGCPLCPVLQREVDELKEQLAAMQSLIDKFCGL